jgi:NADH dehydrogenase
MSGSPRVVIVGGGFGGLAAARALRRATAHVTLLDRKNHHLFQPLLYQVATAALSPANIAAPIRKIVAGHGNCDVVMAEVTDVDNAAATVTALGRRYAYDYLVLAAGVRTNYFGNDGWAAHAPGLKTIDEAIRVRSRFLLAFEQAELEEDPAARTAALTFALVGAGPTGVELAGAIAEISRHTLRSDFRHFDTDTVRILLIDVADRVLPSFDPKLSTRAHSDLEALGVEVMTGTRVIDVGERNLTVERQGQTERIDANNVIWAAGVAAVPLAAALGADTDAVGRIAVGDDLAIPGHPNIFVIGDLAHRVDPRTDAPVPGVAQGALQMGHFVGRTIAVEIAARQRGRATPPRGVFVYRNKGAIATIGRNRAVADVKGWKFGGRFAFIVWAVIHIYFLIDFRHRLLTLAEWIWMYFFYERGVRLITGDDAVLQKANPPLAGSPAADRGCDERSTDR